MKPYLSQIAFSVSAMERTIRFYRGVFGLEDGGGVTAFRGHGAEYVQGIPGIKSKTHWMQDGRPPIQLEFFEFEYPPPLPIPDTWRPCDIGITRVAFEVADIMDVLNKARRLGATNIRGPLMIGNIPHAVFRDPDGICIHVMEVGGGLGGRPSRIAGVANSVSDLDAHAKMYEHGFSLPVVPCDLSPMDALLGLDGAERRSVRIAGEYAWIELSEYACPRPVPRRENHRLTDIGLSHIAFSTSGMKGFDHLFRDLVQHGWFRPNRLRPLKVGPFAGLMYGRDMEYFTIELMYMSPLFHGMFGFRRPGRVDRAAQNVMSKFMEMIYGTA